MRADTASSGSPGWAWISTQVAAEAIGELQGQPGIDWITALESVSVRALVEQGPLQLCLSDQRNLAVITSPEYPGEPLVACRNTALVTLVRDGCRASDAGASAPTFEVLTTASTHRRRACADPGRPPVDREPSLAPSQVRDGPGELGRVAGELQVHHHQVVKPHG